MIPLFYSKEDECVFIITIRHDQIVSERAPLVTDVISFYQDIERFFDRLEMPTPDISYVDINGTEYTCASVSIDREEAPSWVISVPFPLCNLSEFAFINYGDNWFDEIIMDHQQLIEISKDGVQ